MHFVQLLIEKKRMEMIRVAKNHGYSSNELLEVSRQLDHLLNFYLHCKMQSYP